MREFIIVDRIIEDTAVCEKADRSMQEIALELLPKTVQEGDCLYQQGGQFFVDIEETQKRRVQNAKRLADLLDRQKKKQ